MTSDDALYKCRLRVFALAGDLDNVQADVARTSHRGRTPGPVVHMDCFYVCVSHGTQGAVWQYTAIDVATSHGWTELHPGPVKHSSSRWTSALADKVASDLAARGWRFETVTTDHGSELKAQFVPMLEEPGVHYHRMVARPSAA